MGVGKRFARLAAPCAFVAMVVTGPCAALAQTSDASGQISASDASLASSEPASGPSFAASFRPYAALPEPIEAAPGAVDLDSFDPPTGPRVIEQLGTGNASYYGKRFHGRLTANGERFDMNAMTAAHKTLPFGTHVLVTNPRNGKSVMVRINDRGPFIRGRTIDLSRAAAREIGIIRRGHGRVQLDIVEP